MTGPAEFPDRSVSRSLIEDPREVRAQVTTAIDNINDVGAWLSHVWIHHQIPEPGVVYIRRLMSDALVLLSLAPYVKAGQ